MGQPVPERVPLLRVASSFEDLRQDNQASSSQSSIAGLRAPKSPSAQEIVSGFVVSDDFDFKPSTRATWRAKYIWDTLDKPPAERDLLFKLDICLLTLASLGYMIKSLDSNNITQAYVRA